MIVKGMMCCVLVVVCVSCKSLDTTTLHHATQHYTTLHNAVDTVVVRDSVVLRDSVIWRERTIHDTVYITKEIYRDAHHSSLIAHNSTKADTVVVTEYRDRVIEHPPEKYIPPFYKHCTVILFIILAAGVVWIVGKWYIKSRL